MFIVRHLEAGISSVGAAYRDRPVPPQFDLRRRACQARRWRKPMPLLRSFAPKVACHYKHDAPTELTLWLCLGEGLGKFALQPAHKPVRPNVSRPLPARTLKRNKFRAPVAASYTLALWVAACALDSARAARGTWTNLNGRSLATAPAYSGTTVIGLGTLDILNGLALGSSSVSINNSNGAILQLDGGITVSDRSLLNFNTQSGANGLQASSGSNVWAGPVTLGAS